MTEPLRFPGNSSKSAPDSPPETAADRVYTNEEVSEIVRVALRKTKGRDANTVDHAELIAIGKDFGLSEEDINAAFEDIGKTRAVEEIEERARLSLKVHAMVFGVVNAGLFLINMLSDPGFWWFLYPLISWGMALGLHAIAVHYVPALAARLEYWVNYSRQWYGMQCGAVRDGTRAKFKIPGVYGELAEVRGVTLIRGDKLVIEYEVVDVIFGSFRSKVREIAVPLDDIASVRLDRNLWSASLIIESFRLKQLRRLPGSAGGRIKLVFDRDAQAAAERLAEELTDRIAQR